jgi:hypothetical protein
LQNDNVKLRFGFCCRRPAVGTFQNGSFRGGTILVHEIAFSCPKAKIKARFHPKYSRLKLSFMAPRDAHGTISPMDAEIAHEL